MSQDFATPSLNTEPQAFEKLENKNDVFELHQLRRRWETWISSIFIF